MNGLKIIRTKCNFTIGEIADILNVSRQLVSAWENSRKEISAKRLRQLSEFFGIDECFFGEITEEQKQQLDEKAMFLFRYHDKDIFKYKPDKTVKDISRVMVYFRNNEETSLSEEYNKLKKQQEDTIERIDSFIGKKLGHMESEMMRITNYTKIYGDFAGLIESIDEQKPHLKVPYRFEIIDVLDAMRLAFGLLDEETVSGYRKSEYFVGRDNDHIFKLAEAIRNHWLPIEDYHEKLRANFGKNLPPKNNNPLPSVEV
ncbi:MAG: helix-turn-helix transcriptional regulator [Clostridia bacterium]|nr:helix-turn-helix transcriptional regulator [Clostridia bacterium]